MAKASSLTGEELWRYAPDVGVYLARPAPNWLDELDLHTGEPLLHVPNTKPEQPVGLLIPDEPGLRPLA